MDVDAAEDQAPAAGYHDPEFTFERCPLRRPGDIRMLGLLPGGLNSPIECTLVATERVQNQGYIALSYAPIQGEPSHSIKIHTAGGLTGMFNITPDLYAALEKLRDRNNVKYLWIDTICIDQANTQEKNLQVLRMAEVYRRAEHVCVWLGQESDVSRVALDFIHGAGDLLLISTLDQSRPDWTAFYAFISKPWFRYRWAIQAISLARRAILTCGDCTVGWHEFANALSIVQEVITASSNDATRNDDYNDWGHMYLQPAYRLAEIRNGLRDVSRDGVHREFLVTGDLDVEVQDFEVSDPRDAIYALLGLAKDTRQESPDCSSFTHIPINYNSVYPDVCKNYISGRGKGFPGGVPSWLPQESSITVGHSVLGKYGRINADLLVGPPESGKSHYNACGSVAVTGACNFGTGTKINSLFVEGLIVDVITEQKTFARPGGEYSFISDGVPDEWRAAIGCLPSAKEPPNAYWRTLVADRGPNGGATPDFYPVACRDQVNRYIFVANHYKENVGTPLTKAHDALVNKFMQRVQEVVLNRRLIKTKRGRLGLAPYRAKKEDAVGILFGCSVPVLLRQHEDADTLEGYFKIIGECYIHGIMDGQAVEMARRKSGNVTLPTKLLEIRRT